MRLRKSVFWYAQKPEEINTAEGEREAIREDVTLEADDMPAAEVEKEDSTTETPEGDSAVELANEFETMRRPSEVGEETASIGEKASVSEEATPVGSEGVAELTATTASAPSTSAISSKLEQTTQDTADKPIH